MLILTRRAGETIMIGPDIAVTVMAINGSQVRLGLKAPEHIVIDREEVALRKEAERRGER